MPKSLMQQMGVLGLRGRGMVLCALIWGLFALSACLPPLNPPPHGLIHIVAPGIVLRWLGWPLWLGMVARCLVWLTPTVYAVMASRRTHLSNSGLGLLCFPALGYAVSYVGSFVMWCLFGSDGGYSRGIISAGFYGALLGLVWIIAKIPADVSPPLTGPRAREGQTEGQR